MKGLRTTILYIPIVSVLLLLAFGLNFLLNSLGSEDEPSQQEPTAVTAPVPYPHLNYTAPPPEPEFLMTLTAESELPTVPPEPTRNPTPAVTPMPLAEPPIISAPPNLAEPSYTIVFREENLIYAVDRTDDGEEMLLELGTTPPFFLASESVGITTWGDPSPDGDQIALVLSDVPSRDQAPTGTVPRFSIYVYTLDTDTLTLLVQDAVEPAWSPDGGQVAYRHAIFHSLWVADVTTGESTEVFSLTHGMVESITWAPDSQRIAFVETPGVGMWGAIWMVDAISDGQSTQLVPAEQLAGFPSWSPDGEQIAFLSRMGEYSSLHRPVNLWVVEAATNDQHQLTQDIFLTDRAEWSPDGSFLLFSGAHLLESEDATNDVWLLAPADGTLKRLTNDPANELSPAWVSEYSIVFFHSELGRVRELRLDTGELRQITESDRGYILLK